MAEPREPVRRRSTQQTELGFLPALLAPPLLVSIFVGVVTQLVVNRVTEKR